MDDVFNDMVFDAFENLIDQADKEKTVTQTCAWCSSKGKPATATMPDGYPVCDGCRPEVEPYYTCRVCSKPLPGTLGTYARKKFERMLCGSAECQKADDIARGRLCCSKAEYTPCVCLYSYVCPDHAPGGVHVGTHE